MKIVADLHTHTIASTHAYGTIREMAFAAKEVGLLGIGITDHSRGFAEFIGESYFHNNKVIPRDLCGVKMFFGSEINILNGGGLNMSPEIIDKLDFAIAGIHTFNNVYIDKGSEENTKSVIEAMKNTKVRIISHPDDDHTPLDYELLTDAAKEYNVALEVNNSSFLKQESRLNCLENYKKMLTLCEKKKVFIVIDSDAHDPSQVGNVEDAMSFVQKMNFNQDLILNIDFDKTKNFLLNN